MRLAGSKRSTLGSVGFAHLNFIAFTPRWGWSCGSNLAKVCDRAGKVTEGLTNYMNKSRRPAVTVGSALMGCCAKAVTEQA